MTVAEALRGAWRLARAEGRGVAALAQTIRETRDDAHARRDDLAAEVDGYAPQSPPAALLRQLIRFDAVCADLDRLVQEVSDAG